MKTYREKVIELAQKIAKRISFRCPLCLDTITESEASGKTVDEAAEIVIEDSMYWAGELF